MSYLPHMDLNHWEDTPYFANKQFKLKLGKSHGVFLYWKLPRSVLEASGGTTSSEGFSDNTYKEYFFDVDTTHNLSVRLDHKFKVIYYTSYNCLNKGQNGFA